MIQTLSAMLKQQLVLELVPTITEAKFKDQDETLLNKGM